MVGASDRVEQAYGRWYTKPLIDLAEITDRPHVATIHPEDESSSRGGLLVPYRGGQGLVIKFLFPSLNALRSMSITAAAVRIEGKVFAGQTSCDGTLVDFAIAGAALESAP